MRKTLSNFYHSFILQSRLAALLTLVFVAALVWAFVARTGTSAHSAPTAVVRSRVLAQVGPEARPWINLSDVRSVTTEFLGDGAARMALAQQSAIRPLAVASADFDEDGAADFVSSYAHDAGGLFAVHRGNLDSIYPNSPDAQSRKSRGEFTDSPLLPQAIVTQTDMAAEFLVAGDFTNDHHADLAAAFADRLYIFPGDGQGGFGSPQTIELPAQVTAMIGGDFNRVDGVMDLAIAIGGASPRLMVFEDAAGVLETAPEVFELPGESRSLVAGQFDTSGEMDIAAAAGRKIVVVRGRDKSVISRVSTATRSFNFDINSIVAGDFTGNSDTDIAVLAKDGGLHLLDRNGTTKNVGKWNSKKLADTGQGSSSYAVSARVSSLPVDSLVVADPASGEINILTDSNEKITEGESARPPALLSTRFTVEGGASSVVTARLNNDGPSDLVILGNSQPTISFTATLVASTFTVINTNNSGLGSLRQAIINANNNPGADTIAFAIGSGLQTISPSADLPGIIGPVTIDGTTQPGFSGTPVIEINGSNTGSGIGLKVAGGSSVIRGLIVNRCSLQGVQFTQKNGNTLEGCYIGTDSTGLNSLANGIGVALAATSFHTVGGAAMSARNVISGNLDAGVAIFGFNNTLNSVFGNYIGVGADGTTDVGNGGPGISISSTTNKIGSAMAGTGNVISGNDEEGVIILSGNGNTLNLIQGNFIGTASDGTTPLGNAFDGVRIANAPANTVGGTVMGAGNVIANNGSIASDHGVEILGPNANGNKVQGNNINNNLNAGVSITNASNTLVGGPMLGSGNDIAMNGADAIVVVSGTSNTIRQNGTRLNGGLGIDLNDDGVTANDTGDPDTGPNNRQNFPVLTFARGGPDTQIQGTLNSTPNTVFTIDFFLNANCDPSGNGESGLFIGSRDVATNASGNVSFDFTLLGIGSAGGQFVTATATNPNGDTSELSNCQVVCIYSLSAPDVAIGGLGGSSSVDVIAPTGCAWTAVSNVPWVTITSGSSGSGNGTVNFTVGVNPDATPRSGTLTIAGITFTVNQAANPAGCSFMIAPTSATIAAAGGTGSVTVTATLQSCGWTAVSNDPFITVTSPPGGVGTGNGTVTYSVAANPSSTPRTGTITIAGETFTVNQDPAPCAFGLTPMSMTFQAAGGSSSVMVNAPVGCNWTAVSNDAFITITSGASGSGNGTVNYSVAAYGGLTVRMGTMTIAGLTFTVTQLPACNFAITPMAMNFLKAGGNGTITVTADPGCPWTAVSNVPWITITMGASGTGNGTVKYSVAFNPVKAKRTGTITVAGRTFTVTQSG
ncbi:MAG: BACON domain-containing carbohydrate-binding protein [Acidobacteriota bacterium]